MRLFGYGFSVKPDFRVRCFRLIIFVLAILVSSLLIPSGTNLAEILRGHVVKQKPRASRIVFYVVSLTDPNYLSNFLFFATYGITEDEDCDYVIIHQKTSAAEKDILDYLPRLRERKNVRFMKTDNECYDLGAVGNALLTLQERLKSYEFVIWLNSSVRGPFIPLFLRHKVHWTEYLTEKLNEKVKLVGATINCERLPPHGQSLPHVQSYCAATDSVGLSLLLEHDAFKCYKDRDQTIMESEIGISQVILKAGYGIASLMEKYEGADWRFVQKNQMCVQSINPTLENRHVKSLHPYETIFVKYSAGFQHTISYSIAKEISENMLFEEVSS